MSDTPIQIYIFLGQYLVTILLLLPQLHHKNDTWMIKKIKSQKKCFISSLFSVSPCGCSLHSSRGPGRRPTLPALQGPGVHGAQHGVQRGRGPPAHRDPEREGGHHPGRLAHGTPPGGREALSGLTRQYEITLSGKGMETVGEGHDVISVLKWLYRSDSQLPLHDNASL